MSVNNEDMGKVVYMRMHPDYLKYVSGQILEEKFYTGEQFLKSAKASGATFPVEVTSELEVDYEVIFEYGKEGWIRDASEAIWRIGRK